jgi:hypothetical protein
MKKDTPPEFTRRTVLKATVLAVAGGFAVQANAQKIAQNMVQYQNSPKGDQKCAMCVQFEAPSSCKVVDGTISPEGWCAAFAPKA